MVVASHRAVFTLCVVVIFEIQLHGANRSNFMLLSYYLVERTAAFCVYRFLVSFLFNKTNWGLKQLAVFRNTHIFLHNLNI